MEIYVAIIDTLILFVVALDLILLKREKKAIRRAVLLKWL